MYTDKYKYTREEIGLTKPITRKRNGYFARLWCVGLIYFKEDENETYVEERERNHSHTVTRAKHFVHLIFAIQCILGVFFVFFFRFKSKKCASISLWFIPMYFHDKYPDWLCSSNLRMAGIITETSSGKILIVIFRNFHYYALYGLLNRFRKPIIFCISNK